MNRGRKIYISGGTRGYPDLNRAAFDDVETMLEVDGWLPHNPHKANEQNGFSDDEMFEVYIRSDIEALLSSHAICVLPNWQQSEGARLEVSIARALNMKFYRAIEMLDEHGDDAGWFYEHIDAPSVEVEGIDAEARRLVYGERAQTYGHPRGDFDRIAGIWAAILGVPVSAEQVAIMMAGLKLARLADSPKHRDSQVDTIGYILCLARVQEDPAEIAAWNARAAG
jgi:hypothetical protein